MSEEQKEPVQLKTEEAVKKEEKAEDVEDSKDAKGEEKPEGDSYVTSLSKEEEKKLLKVRSVAKHIITPLLHNVAPV